MWAVLGIHGRSGARVDKLGVRCGKLGSDTMRGPGGGGGGNPFDDTRPGGQVARGLKGRAGTLVDQIELSYRMHVMQSTMEIIR
jgi:hypothetical protein